MGVVPPPSPDGPKPEPFTTALRESIGYRFGSGGAAEVVHRIEFQLPSLRKETGPGLPGETVEGGRNRVIFRG